MLLRELKNNLFPKRDGKKCLLHVNANNTIENHSHESSHMTTTESLPEITPFIRVSEISVKPSQKHILAKKILNTYLQELKESIFENPELFLSNFNQPVKTDPQEYLRSLRFYGLQKTDEGTEYTMMQE
jgi:hypothetical protein